MNRLLLVLALIGLTFGQPRSGWPSGGTSGFPRTAGTVNEVREGTMMDIVPDTISDTGTVSLDTAAFRTWWTGACGLPSPLTSWVVDAEPDISTGNPGDSAYAYAMKVQFPSDFTLTGYGYGLEDTPDETDGAFWVAMWSHDSTNNVPSVRYDSTRAFILHEERSSGWNFVGLNETPVTSYAISAGTYWVVCTVDENSGLGTTDPPVEWATSGACAYGHALYVPLPSPAAGYIAAPWDTANDVQHNRVPRIYLQ